jgi:hypothetical protein
VARALDQILQKQIVRALLGFADNQLRTVQGQPLFFADVIVSNGSLCARRIHGFQSLA